MLSSNFLTGISVQSYYHYISGTNLMLGHESVRTLVKSLNGDDTGSKSLGISHLNDIALYTVTTEQLSILVRATSNCGKESNKPPAFLAPIFYTRGKMFLAELRATFLYQRTDSALDFAEVLSTPMFHTLTTSIPLLRMFLNSIHLHSYDPRRRKEA